MRDTREQKRAALLAQAEALIEEFLDWEEQAERPNLTQIEDVALELRGRVWSRAGNDGIGIRMRSNPRSAAVSDVWW